MIRSLVTLLAVLPASLTRSRSPLTPIVSGDARIAYIMWRDGRAEVAELTDALQ